LSTPITAEPYFEMDVVKENIDESGLTTNETKLQNWGDEADREIDTALFYLFAPASFPLTEAIMITEGFTSTDFDKIKQLANERLEAKFWLKTNADDTMMKQSNINLEAFVDRLTQIPATVE